MPEPRNEALFLGPEGAALWPVACVRPSIWNVHIPFAFWLVDTMRPNSVVELPLGDGQSYLALCQAVDRLGLATVVEGVATEQVQDSGFRRIHDPAYGRFSQVRTQRAADVLAGIEDGSVDLLHVTSADDLAMLGGLGKWFKKLSERGVVLLDRPTTGPTHTALWAEIVTEYSTFEFRDGGGLGVVAVGINVDERVLRIVNSDNDALAQTVRGYFARLGESVAMRADAAAAQDRADDAIAQLDRVAHERSELLIEQANLREELHAQAAGGRRAVDKARRKARRVQSSTAGKPSSLVRARSRIVRSVAGTQKAGRVPRKRVTKGELPSKEDPSGAGRSTGELLSLIEYSGLFDSQWYEQRYPDVVDTGMTPIRHFVEFGGPQLRDPNPYFNSHFFADAVRLGAGENPLERYLATDSDTRLSTSQWFDGSRYAQAQRVPSAQTALGHFIAEGGGSTPFPMPLRQPKRIRVVFVSGESHTAGHRYRVEDIASALPATDFDVVVTSPADYPTMTYAVENADVVWAWRVAWSEPVRHIYSVARSLGVTVVADIDDLVFSGDLVESGLVDGVRSLHLEPEKAAKSFRSRGQALARADLRVATTDFLVDQIRADFGSALEIPNGYDEESWNMSVRAIEVRPSDGLIRIGYAGGSLTHQKDLCVAIPAICRVLRENPATRFVAFSGFLDIREFPELVELVDQVEWRRPVPVSRLALEYARFSINIAPLELDNPFCDAKSALKFHEAALVGVPTVASPTVPFRNVMRHGVNGYLAEREQDWYERLSELVGSSAKRAELAGQARQDVLWNFGPCRRGLLARAALQVAAGRMELLSYAQVAPESVYGRFARAEMKTEYFQESRPAGRVTCLVVIDVDDEQAACRTLESLREQDEHSLDLIVVDARGGATTPVVADWLRRDSDRFGSVRLVRPQYRAATARILNWACWASRTLRVVIVRTGAVLAPDFVYKLAETQTLSCSLAVLPPTHIGFEQAAQAKDALLVTLEGWTAVGGFESGSNPVFELLERFASAGLPVAITPPD